MEERLTKQLSNERESFTKQLSEERERCFKEKNNMREYYVADKKKIEEKYIKQLESKSAEQKLAQTLFEKILATEEILAKMKVQLIEVHDTQKKLDFNIFQKPTTASIVAGKK